MDSRPPQNSRPCQDRCRVALESQKGPDSRDRPRRCRLQVAIAPVTRPLSNEPTSPRVSWGWHLRTVRPAARLRRARNTQRPNPPNLSYRPNTMRHLSNVRSEWRGVDEPPPPVCATGLLHSQPHALGSGAVFGFARPPMMQIPRHRGGVVQPGRAVFLKSTRRGFEFLRPVPKGAPARSSVFRFTRCPHRR
jgi:hypothetical protein